MLILTRRPGERVVIGDDVIVTVMEVSGQTVRLGIAAPGGIPVYREEIWLAVQEENRAAAEASVQELPEVPEAGSARAGGAEGGVAEPHAQAPPGDAAQRPS
jgi:carbon storage regulator